MKSHIELVKDWLLKCPFLESKEIKTEFLEADDNKSQYSLEQNSIPNSLVKGNILGTKLNGMLSFTLAGRYDFDTITDTENNENIKTIENIAEWIMLQEMAKNYPTMNDDELVKGLSITQSPFLYGVDKGQNYSRYQFSFQITYEKRV